MSIIYAGQQDNAYAHASFNISSSTNATPIVLTTTAPHDLLEGDRVVVSGHASNTAANGVWSVHVIDASNVALYGTVGLGGLTGASVGNGVGGLTGTVQGLGLLPQTTLPSDSDAPSAASVNVGFEGSFDALQKVAINTGILKTVASMVRVKDQVTAGVYARTPFIDMTVPQSSGTYPLSRVIDSGTNYPGDFFYIAGGAPPPDVLSGDIVECTFQTQVDTTQAPAGYIYIGLGYEYFEQGASQTNTFTKVPGSMVLIQQNTQNAVTLNGRFVVSLGVQRSKKLQVYIIARVLNGIGNTRVAFFDDGIWTARVLRPTNNVAG